MPRLAPIEIPQASDPVELPREEELPEDVAEFYSSAANQQVTAANLVTIQNLTAFCLQ